MKPVSFFCLMAVLLALSAAGCTGNSAPGDNEFIIEGYVNNIPDSSTITLFANYGNVGKSVAVDTVTGGRFMFRDTVSCLKKYSIMGGKGFPSVSLEVWVAPGERIRIRGNDNLVETWTVKSGLPYQRYEDEYRKAGFPERALVLENRVLMNDVASEMRAAVGNDQTALRRAREKMDSIFKVNAPLDSIVDIRKLDYLAEAPVNEIWMEKYGSYVRILQYDPDNFNADRIRSLYSRLSEDDLQTETGRMIYEYMHLPERVGVGDEMVDGDLYDKDGNLRHLSEFNGRYILLDFWSQGCGPCIASFPEMEEVIAAYGDRLEVVGISSDRKDIWLKYLSENKVGGNQWNELRMGNTGLAAAYGVTGIPHYVMISPDGRILDIWAGYARNYLKSKVEALVK